MFSLLFTPMGRYLLIGGLVFAVIIGAYVKIKSDAVAELEAAAMADALKRTSDAIRAGDSVRVDGERLRDPDRNQRD